MSGPGLRVPVTDTDHGVLDIEEQVLAAAGRGPLALRGAGPGQ